MIMLPRRFYFDNALDDLFEEEGAKMKCDIYEKENTYHVDMDLPGFKKDEIKVSKDIGLNDLPSCLLRTNRYFIDEARRRRKR